jgi:hypothetical protein
MLQRPKNGGEVESRMWWMGIASRQSTRTSNEIKVLAGLKFGRRMRKKRTEEQLRSGHLPSMTSKLGKEHREEKRHHKYSAIMQYQHIIMQQDKEYQEQGVSRERRQRHRHI